MGGIRQLSFFAKIVVIHFHHQRQTKRLMTTTLESNYGFFFTTTTSHKTLASRLDLVFSSETHLQHLDLIVSEQNQADIHLAASAWAKQHGSDLTIQLLLCPHTSTMEIMADNSHEGILTAYAYHEEDGYTPLSYACAEQLENVVCKLRSQDTNVFVISGSQAALIV